ncbi:hypothetical protein [Methylosinus sp. KRF6]|uniref:hypothetical protein n=1 Tax=Methylosinus sp. KRF6 TaxID=2846853 RepID=UPI001C0C608B|nr:hypothetical protein [Methylosinus sp. KRF6]MBU3887199.1 hypothetical protein [Methylosinus sp. KRF6]
MKIPEIAARIAASARREPAFVASRDGELQKVGAAVAEISQPSTAFVAELGAGREGDFQSAAGDFDATILRQIDDEVARCGQRKGLITGSADGSGNLKPEPPDSRDF